MKRRSYKYFRRKQSEKVNKFWGYIQADPNYLKLKDKVKEDFIDLLLYGKSVFIYKNSNN